ncbi:hypothetical protein ABZ557_30890 [Streptomyces sp. NPDC019645]|uniref:hypothetical protein n=1 Tax=Streptomyces sp. NPDC019645 TaxID=3154786 RepID=UPI0033DBF7EE
MLVPSLALSPLQHRVLRELNLSDLPAPESGAMPWAARGLDADDVRDALPTLLWGGLVERKGGVDGLITLTPLGSASLHAAECDELTARLSAVASFADTVASRAAPRSAGHALKRLAEGMWTLAQAEAHVRSEGQ